jgi:hypothetical protein
MDKSVLDKFMGEMLTLLQSAEKFTMEQLPLVAKEVLAYNMAMAIAGVLLGVVMATVGFLAIKRILKEDPELDSILNFFATLGLAVLSLVGIIFVCTNVPTILQIHFAPRLYLIEYFAHLVQHVK